ncbi:MAG TPA: hypothetical protein VEO74_09070, partial [Thermoanaerobaculia bacterium]|nr:hypothetical protein [Thermoanaerobaculia bacterium]
MPLLRAVDAMKKAAIVLVLLQFLVLSAHAAEPKECSFCAGGVVDSKSVLPAAPVPLLTEITLEDFAAIDAMTPAQRAKTVVLIRYALDSGKEPLASVEERTKTIIEWARTRGPFNAIGVRVDGADEATAAYAIKRLAVMAQGLNVASKIVSASTPPASALPYVDALITDNAAKTVAWIVENDPSKKAWAIVAPQSPNVFFDVARAYADGAVRAYVQQADAATLAAMPSLNQAFTGDWSYDPTSKVETLDAKGNKTDLQTLTFVRGEDLRTIVVPRGDAAAATIASLPNDRYVKPRRVDAAGERDVTDVGAKGGHFLIGMQPVKTPFVFTVEHNEQPRRNVTKEALEIATKRGIAVEEIIRNHQAYKSYQESIQPKYIARDTTKLRFELTGGEAIEATISGDYFSDPGNRADWVWQDFFINGVKWKYGKIPELPLIQPEKVTQLPLDIHLTNEYRYQFVREADLLGYHTYEVRFEPPPNAPAALPLYRGTVWIDTRTWARIRISMIQLNLTGEVLSNDERVDFVPFARASHAPLSAADVEKTDAREVLWLPQVVGAQQVVSAAGRANPVLRETTFTNFRIAPDDFAQRLAEASASDARMVRETNAGLRYLEKTSGGERVVKEGFDTARTFMLGGVHHDSGLQYPVLPLGGIDYFNFDLGHRGIQTNVFFAGIVVAANATNPNVGNTRTNVGADLFAIAVPTQNTMYRDGIERPDEAVRQLPTNFSLRAGHPFLQFGKVDVGFSIGHVSYKRADDTAANFIIPSSTFVLSPSIDASYARWGYTATAFYDYNKRTSWKPWGKNLAEYDPKEYDPNQKTFTEFGASLAKSFYLPKFQRLGIAINYESGQRLDRFSKYELGFFGSQRVHGIRSGTVRADKALLGHLSYGFVFSDQFRLEAFYDHGLISDRTPGYRRKPFQGLGIAGQTVGPWGTLLRLDIGKT